MSEKTMPAGQLHVLLWHYFTSDPYPSPCGCHEEFVESLMTDGLIDYAPDREKFDSNEMSATERGRVYIDAILKVSLPVQRWVAA